MLRSMKLGISFLGSLIVSYETKNMETALTESNDTFTQTETTFIHDIYRVYVVERKSIRAINIRSVPQ